MAYLNQEGRGKKTEKKHKKKGRKKSTPNIKRDVGLGDGDGAAVSVGLGAGIVVRFDIFYFCIILILGWIIETKTT